MRKPSKPVLLSEATQDPDLRTHPPKVKTLARARACAKARSKALYSGEARGSQLDADKLLAVLMGLKKGNFDVRLPLGWTGLAGKIADTVNDLAELMSQSTKDLSRISRMVGKEGRIDERLSSGTAVGAWGERVDSVNTLIDCLANPISKTERVTGTVAESDLSRQISALTAANRELEAFNYSIAHDLRTPLRSLGGFAHALLEDESANLSSLGLEYVRRIAQSASYMDTLLLDLLDYSRLTRAEMTFSPVSLDESVSELLSLVEEEIRERAARIEVSAPLGKVQAHLPTLKQIVTNLISNALKFTVPGRQPRLRIYTSKQGDFVRLWVEDNGIGIAPEHFRKVFGLFQRLHDTQTYPGTGIGLALVRKGAQRMGGRVGIESEPGHGSRFWVDLPPASVNPTLHSSVPKAQPQGQ